MEDPSKISNDDSTSISTVDRPLYIIVIRHSERLDYVIRDTTPNGNWLIGQECPYDPPLTDNGMQMGYQLGVYLQKDIVVDCNSTNNTTLQNNKIPPITAIYTSPFLRCRQTACDIRKGLVSNATTGSTITSPSTSSPDNSGTEPVHTHTIPPIRYEWGLCESINNSWYKSWSLPDSNGTWDGSGYSMMDHDNTTNDTATFTNGVHVAATVPIQKIIIPTIENRCTNDIELDNNNEQQKSSLSSIEQEYCYVTAHVESSHDQRQRMVSTIDNIITTHHTTSTANSNNTNSSSVGQTIVFISHGGPVTHLYEAFTNKGWYVHGEATYCCYSIYKLINNIDNTSTSNNDTIEKDNSTTTGTTGTIEKDNSTTTGTTGTTSSNNDDNDTLQMLYKWEPISINQSIFTD